MPPKRQVVGSIPIVETNLALEAFQWAFFLIGLTQLNGVEVAKMNAAWVVFAAALYWFGLVAYHNTGFFRDVVQAGHSAYLYAIVAGLFALWLLQWTRVGKSGLETPEPPGPQRLR